MRSARHAGFTLIEVLVALVIVAVGMIALMGALNSSASAISYMRDKTFSEWVALNQIATLRLQMQQGQIPPVGTTTGELNYANRSWHWRQDVVATQVQGMVRVDLKVRPSELKAGDDAGWFVTVSGLIGNSVGTPTGLLPVWGGGGTTGLPGSTAVLPGQTVINGSMSSSPLGTDSSGSSFDSSTSLGNGSSTSSGSNPNGGLGNGTSGLGNSTSGFGNGNSDSSGNSSNSNNPVQPQSPDDGPEPQ